MRTSKLVVQKWWWLWYKGMNISFFFFFFFFKKKTLCNQCVNEIIAMCNRVHVNFFCLNNISWLSQELCENKGKCNHRDLNSLYAIMFHSCCLACVLINKKGMAIIEIWIFSLYAIMFNSMLSLVLFLTISDSFVDWYKKRCLLNKNVNKKK